MPMEYEYFAEDVDGTGLKPGPQPNFEEFFRSELARLKQSILKEFDLSMGAHSAYVSSCANLFQNSQVDVAKKDEANPKSSRCSSRGDIRLPSRSSEFNDTENDDEYRKPSARGSDMSRGLSTWSTADIKQLSIGKSTLRLTVNDETVKGKGRRQSMIEFIKNPAFDFCITGIVVVNCIFMCCQAQFDGIEMGNKAFGYSGTEYSSSMKLFFQITDHVFLSIYFAEMLVKLLVLHLGYFKSPWNVLDGMAVVVGFISVLVSNVISINPALVRLTKGAKLLRLSHVLRSLQFFDSFVLLARSLKASVNALFWSMSFILVMILASAFFVNQALQGYFEDAVGQPNAAKDDAFSVFLYYGTLTRAIVSFFEMTLGNWGPRTWLLLNNVGEAWAVFMIFYKVTAGFAVLNVINAVFLRQTLKVADSIDGFAVEQVKKDIANYHMRVSELFDALDVSGDGQLSYDELELICQSTSLKALMELMNVDTHDIGELWKALDKGDGSIDKEMFIEGFGRLKGGATAIDAMCIKDMLRQDALCIKDMLRQITTTVAKIGAGSRGGHGGGANGCGYSQGKASVSWSDDCFGKSSNETSTSSTDNDWVGI